MHLLHHIFIICCYILYLFHIVLHFYIVFMMEINKLNWTDVRISELRIKTHAWCAIINKWTKNLQTFLMIDKPKICYSVLCRMLLYNSVSDNEKVSKFQPTNKNISRLVQEKNNNIGHWECGPQNTKNIMVMLKERDTAKSIKDAWILLHK